MNFAWGQFYQPSFRSHVRSHKKFGPDRLSRFNVDWIHTDKQTDKQSIYIYRYIYIYCVVCPVNPKNMMSIQHKPNLTLVLVFKTYSTLEIWTMKHQQRSLIQLTPLFSFQRPRQEYSRLIYKKSTKFVCLLTRIISIICCLWNKTKKSKCHSSKSK